MSHDFCYVIAAKYWELGKYCESTVGCFVFWTLTGTVKPQFILQVWSVVSFWSYFSYFDDTGPLWLTAHGHPKCFFWVSPERESGLCAFLSASVHVFLAAHLSGAAGPAFHFCDWQTALIYMEEQWYLLEHGQLLSVFLLSALAVLSLTPMRIFMKLLISPLAFFFNFPSLPGFNYTFYLYFTKCHKYTFACVAFV